MSAAEFVALALHYHQAGNLRQAEELYRQALQADPLNADAHHLLGTVALQTGRYEQAVLSIRQALALNPGAAPYYSNLGLAYVALGRLDEAVATYQQALRLSPQEAETHYKLGAALHLQNKLNDAIAQYREALRLRPSYAEAHDNLGTALGGKGQHDEAINHFRMALRLNPGLAEAHNHMGMALTEQGKLDAAEACYRQALRCKPGFVEALNNLGNALCDQGKLDEAVVTYRQALKLRPEDAVAHYNLGSALHRLDRSEEAVTHFHKALRVQPNYAAAHNNLGNVLADQGKLDEAATHFQWALQLEPDSSDACHNLGIVLADQGRLDEAIACCQKALSLDAKTEAGAKANLSPSSAPQRTKRIRVLLATLLPPIYQSSEELMGWRQRFTDNLRVLQEARFRVDLTNDTAHPSFYLAYQGKNDRDLQARLGEMYTAPSVQVPPVPSAGRSDSDKIRVGFISRYFKEHTIGRLMGGLISHLSRETFHVTVLSLGSHDDPLSRRIQQDADAFLQVPSHLPSARRLIADQHLDVLFYTDIGMDRTTYSLAFSRLAPVQCVTWGHPDTTGVPTLDYFISTEDLETESSAEHYTEQLVKLKRLPVYYYRPVLPSRLKDRAHFRLPEKGALYGCPQSLFKFHPEFDAILGNILRQDPKGTLVLIRGKYAHWQKLLEERFRKTLPDVIERIHFVPPLDPAHFLNLNALFDVLLDPLHFGGGNTSYEGLAMGVPIVTLPSPFMRARYLYALYQQMGVTDCVVSSPEEYANLAVKLGTDADYRSAVRAKILAASDAIFENSDGIGELEQFFQEAVRQARVGLPANAWPQGRSSQ